jgi:uncharacterized protein (DUF2062 family)
MLFTPRHKPTFSARLQSWLWPKRGIRRAWMYIWHRVTRISATPHVIALGFAAGAFASFTPFVGFHFVLAGILAFCVGGNILASALGTGVGNPLTFPFIWLSTYNLGGMVLGYERRDQIDLTIPDGTIIGLASAPGASFSTIWEAVSPVMVPMLAGCIPLGLLAGVLGYFFVYPAVDGYQRRRKHRLAVRHQHNKAQLPS